ncbi:hypothetical protein DM01DRAFT_1222808 [Hesseltinella vesiculosa]|uniref:Uncharacterized protein n=1 Tax=Hesseltinella vesiculosa TaxID=101127 RepID=A0A1X2GPD9_9FUNG|nr:hypothetical protein DM01DRAFT_1222808 [Hesseltinella vesiculosa]
MASALLDFPYLHLGIPSFLRVNLFLNIHVHFFFVHFCLSPSVRFIFFYFFLYLCFFLYRKI